MSTKTLTFVVCKAGALQSLTWLPKLSSPAGTYGVVRMDTGATVVNDATAFALSGDFLYSYTFTEPAADLTYRYYVEAIVDEITYWIPRTTTYVASAMLAVGRYTDSHRVESAFGIDNVQKWLALDDTDEASDYALRAYQFIADAEREIDDLLRGSPCEVPFATEVPGVVTQIATNMAALRMYESRGVVDMNPDTGQVQHRLQFQSKWVDRQIGRIKSGQIRFSGEKVTRHPTILS